METPLQTITEISLFVKFAKKHLSDGDLTRLKVELAANPEMGEIIVGTGGIRKFRFATKGRGKSGSTRIFTLYLNDRKPVYLITGIEKNRKDNLNAADKAALKKIVDLIKKGEM